MVTAYKRHSSRYRQCARPLNGESTMCGRGYGYARDVANYLFAQNGGHFSVVANEEGKRVQVQIPRKALRVRGLLAAIEKGLNLCPRRAFTEIQSCHIPPWRPATRQINPQCPPRKLKTYKVIEREPQKANRQALPCYFLCRRPAHSLL